MQIRGFLVGTTLACAAGIVAPPSIGAQLGVQRDRNVPNVYAITNAKIITVAGPAIDRGTVVVRNGVITAVGASIPVPGDARVIDGNGLTVYPGLIDANSSLGLGTDATAGATAGGRGGRGAGGRGATPAQQAAPVGAPNSLHPVGLQPELAAVDLVHPDADAFVGPQSAGITAVQSVPATGIFRGLAAVVNLGGSNAQAMIIKAPVAEHIGFTPQRGGGYPNSLLGVFSALRQMLLDAQHYGAEQAAYAKNPRGMHRPEIDPSLDALQPVLARQIPVVMEASSQREIERALDLAKEFNIRAIIAGGDEADKVAARLKAENVPVLISLNFPRRPQASPDADPEPIRVLRARVEAPKLAGKLAQAGVKFAFEDGGMSNWADFLTNAGRTSEGGLSAEQTIRALTLSPAEILGVSDRLGTIESGKIANLTITRGDLFTGRVTQVFIDGVPVEVRAAAAANGAASLANGTWTITVTLDEGEKPVTLALQQAGDQLRGTIQGSLGSSQISNGSIGANGELQFTASVTMAAGTEEARFTGTISGNVVRGTVAIVGHPQGTFIGSRPDTGQGGGRRGRPPILQGGGWRVEGGDETTTATQTTATQRMLLREIGEPI
ncbi:MAG TPA: amidohydrolase family protein [Gemmatimonadaceae bacterium]|nr:amidohydrolase family protein [Gemmatimonadaceae bacterium]